MCSQEKQSCSTSPIYVMENPSTESYALLASVAQQGNELYRLRAERDAYYGYATELRADLKELQELVDRRYRELRQKAAARGVPLDAGLHEKARAWTQAVEKCYLGATRLGAKLYQSTRLDSTKAESSFLYTAPKASHSVAHYVHWKVPFLNLYLMSNKE